MLTKKLINRLILYKIWNPTLMRVLPRTCPIFIFNNCRISFIVIDKYQRPRNKNKIKMLGFKSNIENLQTHPVKCTLQITDKNLCHNALLYFNKLLRCMFLSKRE